MNDKKILIIASRNEGKIKEIKNILAGVPFEIKSLVDIKLDIDIKETGKTFEENAILKAKIIGEKTGLLTLADDSGLEVDALNGKPGIYSSRYTEGTDLDRINKLLDELKNIPKEKRTARFRSVVALYIPQSVIPSVSEVSLGLSGVAFARDSSTPLRSARNDDFRIVTFEGECKGRIIDQPRGNNGFGYDPIFYNLDLGKTNAEVNLEEKNRVSHRARAIIKCREVLQKLL